MTMKWKKKTLFLVVTAVGISAAVVACIFLIPPARKRLEKREKPTTATTGRSQIRQLNLVRDNKTCEECTVVGARMIRLMAKEGRKVHPCEDFYNYACGSFGEHYSKPERWDSYGWHDVYSKELDLTVKSILEEPDSFKQADSLTKAKIVYQTCIDTDSIEENSMKDLRGVLSQNGMGEWPLLKTDWNDCRVDLEWRMAKLNAMGLDSLFHLDVQYGEKEQKLYAVLRLANPLVEDICLDPLPENISLILEERTPKHRQILESVLRLLNVNMNNVTDLDIDELFEFDFYFCNVTKEARLTTPVQDVSTLNTTVTNLAGISTQINWLKWKYYIFSELNLDFKHNEHFIFVDNIESSIEGINDLIQETSSKTLANYLTWRFVLNHLGFLGKEFRLIQELYPKLIATSLGPLQTRPQRWIPERWRQCVLLVKKLMPLALIRPYSESLQMLPREEEKENILSMISDQYKHIMLNTTQLKNTAERSKSNHMIDIVRHRTLLTYPYKAERYFRDFYVDAGISTHSFLRNGLKLRNRHMKNLLSGVFRDKRTDDMEYAIHTLYSPFDSEMYSFFRGKQIVISLGALQYCPVKGVPFPKFVTLSTFGFMYAHELAHGFDLRALDASTGQNWTTWEPETLNKAKERARCFLKQYRESHNMTIEEALEKTTLNEDLVDQQALIIAHQAYLTYLNKSKDEQNLPNIRLTNKQLFFVSYAQQFCESRRREDSPSITISKHRTLNAHSTPSPGRRRVNGILKNYGPFSQAFHCYRDDPMNQPTCPSLWERSP